ncbi:MAG: hypothetical protein ACK5PR_03085 [bacterium]
MTRYSDVGRSGVGGALIILPGETEAGLRERNYAQEKSGGLFETMNEVRWLQFRDPQKNLIYR